MFLVRLVLWPFKAALRALGFTFKTGYRTGRVPMRLTRGAARVLGVRGVLLFFAGLALGLLFAPWPGRELRDRLRQMMEGGGLGDEAIHEKVVFELSHAPRTWHLPQPTVTIEGGRVRLSGDVPHEEARAELGRVAAAIPGVAGVDNQIVVAAED